MRETSPSLSRIPVLAVMILLCYLFSPLTGQQNKLLYLWHEVPASHLLNPAVQTSCKWVVGIPLISSIHANYNNTATTFNQAFPSGIEADPNFGMLTSRSRGKDMISLESHLNLVFVGYRNEDRYFTFAISEKVSGSFMWPRSLPGLVARGNAVYLGEEVNLNGISLGYAHYREYALGYSRRINNDLLLGIRGKLLFGKSGMYTSRSRNSLYTDPTTYDLRGLADYHFHRSLPLEILYDVHELPSGIALHDDFSPASYLLNRKNPGLAIDAGFVREYPNDFTLSGSVLDIGVIRWATNPENLSYTHEITYAGTGGESPFNSIEHTTQLLDSLGRLYQESLSYNPYYSYLSPRVYLGLKKEWHPGLSSGLVYSGQVYRYKIHHSFTVTGQALVRDRLIAGLSWSVLNGSANQVGAGLGLTGKGMQFHLVTDNLIGMIKPYDARHFNLRLGINLIFGCGRDRSGMHPGCPWIQNAERKAERYRNLRR